MGTSLLDLPVSRLQAIQDPPLPWSFAARQAVGLIKNFSTGLSFVVAADEIRLAWGEYLVNQEQWPSIVTASVLQVVQGPPELWLASLSGGAVVVILPERSCLQCVKAGSSVSFYLADIIHVEDSQYRACFNFLETLVPKSSLHVAKRHSDESEGNSVQAKLHSEEQSSQSPVDVSKFPGGKKQYAETPSQYEDPDDEDSSPVELALLPTCQIAFDLNTLDPKSIGLTEPIEAFTLQRVWNERSLHPNWIFAHVAQVSGKAESTIRLQDSPPDLNPDEPSVVWSLPEERSLIGKLLKPGYQVLIKNPTIQPTGSSFDVFCTENSAVFYRQDADQLDSPAPKALQGQPEGNGNRARKRQRLSSALTKTVTPVTTKDIKNDLPCTGSEANLVVLSRVVSKPICAEPFVLIVPCEDNVTVRVVELDAHHIAERLSVGDEVLFHQMGWMSTRSPDGSQVGEGWVARGCEVLPVMPGFLYSGFAREITSVRHLSIIYTGATSGTRVLRVCIRDVTLCKKDRYVLLNVEDQVCDRERSKVQAAQGCEGQVLTRRRGIEELFQTNSPDLFWTDNPDKVVQESMDRLKAETWLVIVKHSPLLSPGIPEICCCVPARGFE